MDITDTLQKTYIPQAALMVYQASSSEGGNYYMETRKILDDGSFGRAMPVSRKFILSLIQQFRDEHEQKLPFGPLPDNFLYADPRIGHEKYVWWNPPQKRPQFFQKELRMKDTDYNMPGVIYCVKGGRLAVYAFKGKKPNPKQKLLFGPFYNYYEDGGICLGNATVEWPATLTWKDIAEHWEKMFWASINSHTMTNPMKRGHVLNAELKKAITGPFDTNTLVSTNFTINEILRKD